MVAATEPVELTLLQEALAWQWGLDFRHWRPVSFRRRVRAFARTHGYGGPADLIPLVLRDARWRDALVASLARRHGALFSDPQTWRALRWEVLPRLRTWPRLRFWVPGVASGEDVWSLAILLHEEGLADRSQIWATGMSETMLATCRAGAWEDTSFAEWEANHRAAGGRDELARFRVGADDDAIRLAPSLLERVSFGLHHLGADGPHNSFQAIVCRDVLVDFDPDLAGLAWRGIHGSLVPFGMVVLGRGERIEGAPNAGDYLRLEGPHATPETPVWRRVRG